MSEAGLRTDFWNEFSHSIAQRPDWPLGSFKHQHGSKAYIEFEARLGAGFRPRAVFHTQDNELRAEILTTGNAQRLDLLDRLIAVGSRLETLHCGIAEVSVAPNRSDGKVQIVWRDAMTRNRRLWPVHQDWIAETLLDLRDTMVAQIMRDTLS